MQAPPENRCFPVKMIPHSVWHIFTGSSWNKQF